MIHEPKILIVDLGSQLTLVIARTLREAGFRSAVLSPKRAGVWLEKHRPRAVILSGSDKSVYAADAPQPPEKILTLGIPVLGICYGMQWIALRFGGEVKRERDNIEFGPAHVGLENSILFSGIPDKRQLVWTSHGDSVTACPAGFEITARNDDGTGIQAICDSNRQIWGVQFHPEVPQTPRGQQMLHNFVRHICNCVPDWQPGNIVEEIRGEVASHTNIRAILGFSAGVDSTTMAAILAPVMGDRLLGVCIDGGQMRQNELDEVKRHAEAAGLKLKIISASDTFLTAFGNVSSFDSEVKRKQVFQKYYQHFLEDAAVSFGASHVVQGTLAPDLIESGATGGDIIKTHHNNIKWNIDVGEMVPLSTFFKHEVRGIAASLGLPDSVVQREPFPGPGLFLRVFGGMVTGERLNIVRYADHEVREILKDSEGVPEISQLVVGLCCVNTTGVKGDGRAYGPSIVVRGIRTTDFMTGEGVELPVEARRRIKKTLTRHKGIVRVWFDEMDKPPATTEFE